MNTTATQHNVLRARLGVIYPQDVPRPDLEQRIVDAIITAVGELDGRLDVLQLDLAARPDWDEFGPINRVTGQHLWDRPADGSPA